MIKNIVREQKLELWLWELELMSKFKLWIISKKKKIENKSPVSLFNFLCLN
jgi:hypothetical protein